MSSHDSKIITTLYQRRQIEQALKALGQTSNEEELAQRAAEIAQHGEAVLPALLAQLGTQNPQLRGGLAHVARLLPRDLIVPSLRAIAGDPGRSNSERMTAMTILERFLGETLEPDLFRGLGDPRMLALESLREALTEIRKNPRVLMEYLTQLEGEPAEVALMIVEATARLDPSEVVELLRMLSMDPRQPVAQAALHRLGSLRLPTAATALQSLLPNLSEKLKPLAERSLRKLAFSSILPLPDMSSWRALASPMDGEGNYTLWFIPWSVGQDRLPALRLQSRPGCQTGTGDEYPPLTEPHGTLISLLLNDRTGIREVFGGETIPLAQLPAAQPAGTIHVMRVPRAGTIMLLEIPFDSGRGMLASAVSRHMAQGQVLPMLYRFYSALIWASPWSQPQERSLELEAGEENWPLERSLQLLNHPAFQAWGVQEAWVYDLAERLYQRAGSSWHDEETAAIASKIALRAFTDEMLDRLAGRLQYMSQWLHWAEETELGRLAAWTAAHLREGPPTSHPFLLRLAEAGLQMAIFNLARGVDLRYFDLT